MRVDGEIMNIIAIGVTSAVAASLIINGFRRHGWARFFCLTAAVLVLVLTFWYGLVQATSHIWS